jgi:CRP/FNR family transcriptional regulator, cyclic AMP receptor protein
MSTTHPLPAKGNCEDCTLRQEEFFCDLPPAALRTLAAIEFNTTYPQGTVLFAEGSAPQAVLMLCKGRVKISVTSSEGKTLILRVAKAGEALGLHAVISNKPYQATAETLEPCQVNVLRRDDFLRFLRAHAEAALRVAQQLSSSYETACDQARCIGLSSSAPEKLARFLLDWTANGQETRQGVRTVMTLTHEEIGQMIGASRETVTRTLGQFKSRQLVTLKGAIMVVPDRSALEKLVSA